jgi:hypothetical protein
MNKKLNISKEFLIDKPFEDTVSTLDSIASSKYENSMYSTFGNVISADPPEYSLMTKWYSIGRPLFAEITSTKIKVKIFPLDNKSKISITTITNPVFYLYFFVFILLTVIAILTLQNLGAPALFLSFAIVTIVFDRWKKGDLIERFERDIKIKVTK